MKNKNWKIIYSSYEGVQKRAVELLSKEIGDLLLRDPGVYSVHTLACEKVGAPVDKNAFIIGTLAENELLRKYLSREDIPARGYCVRVIDNPDNPDLQLVLIAGDTAEAVLWGVIDFIDDGVPAIAPRSGGVPYENYIFDAPRLAKYESKRAPKGDIRSVFIWGHQINDFRDFFENLARLRFNEIIIWNDYTPINAEEVVDYAHSWGLSVIWGFAWGWSTNCGNADLSNIDKLSDEIFENWKTQWKPLSGDGIYFQSFTELSQETINGLSIAESVVKLVNKTCARILEDDPTLRIQFGLHADSVLSNIDVINKTDKRIEILWENCGGFPYYYSGYDFEKTFANTETILAQDHDIGMAFKKMAKLDWTRFNYQPGPFILGKCGKGVLKEDLATIDQIWRDVTPIWLNHGEKVYKIIKRIHERPGKKVSLNVVGNLIGPIRFPLALVAELFWSTDEDYNQIVTRVCKRKIVTI